MRVRDMVRELVLNKSILLRTILDKRGEDAQVNMVVCSARCWSPTNAVR
ncbi:MAG: hypothetical protein R2867_07195 [Caldilineaceae bacterium]